VTPPEGRLGVDDPVGLEERIDEGGHCAGRAGARCAGQIEFVWSYARRNASTNFPRKTRLRTFTGRKKPAYFG
jgi:hypothetical protein